MAQFANIQGSVFRASWSDFHRRGPGEKNWPKNQVYARKPKTHINRVDMFCRCGHIFSACLNAAFMSHGHGISWCTFIFDVQKAA